MTEEELYQHFIGAGKVGTAATMKHTPRIGGSGKTKRGSGTTVSTRSKSKKKSKSGKSNNAVFNLLVQMEQSSTLEGQRLEIDQLRAQISTDKTSFLTHKKSYREDRMEVHRLMKDLREKGISEGEMADDYDYDIATKDVAETEKTMNEIKARLATRKEELCQLEDELKSATATETDPEWDGEVGEEDDGKEVGEGDEYDSDFSSMKSNNGSEDLPDDKIPEVETIDDTYEFPNYEDI